MAINKKNKVNSVSNSSSKLAKDYPLKEFKKYLEKSGVDSASSTYLSRLRNLPNNSSRILLKNVYSALKCGCSVVAIGYVEKAIVELGNLKGKSKPVSDAISILRKYKNYIKLLQNTIELSDDCRVENLTMQKTLSKKYMAGAIDAMSSLIVALGGEDNFIKLAIENSFFICGANEAVKRFEYICAPNDDSLPARISTKEDLDTKQKPLQPDTSLSKGHEALYEDGNYKVKIILDGNGNAKVCSLINELTGYALSAKYNDKIVKDFVISHIWGNATDPRYFTNLWNIVLVPAWANHLLDKDPLAKTVESKFKATLMKICDSHYDMDRLDWSKLELDKPCINEKDILKGKTYTIRILNRKEDNIIGKITTEVIKL